MDKLTNYADAARRILREVPLIGTLLLATLYIQFATKTNWEIS